MLYMLDTNACIGIIKNNPPVLRQRLFQLDVAQVAKYQSKSFHA
jgi:predicted nucleic acid-binding protein